MNADDAENRMEPQPYHVEIRRRPRWKRALLMPRTFWRYRRAGCRVWPSLKFAALTVMF